MQVAECNKSLIDSTRADVNRLLSKFGKEDNNEDEVGNSINAIKEHLIELDERDTKTSTGLANLNASVYKELKAKQVQSVFAFCYTAPFVKAFFNLIVFSIPNCSISQTLAYCSNLICPPFLFSFIFFCFHFFLVFIFLLPSFLLSFLTS